MILEGFLLEVKSQQNWQSSFRLLFFVAIISVLIVDNSLADAKQDPYEILSRKAESIESSNHISGWAYIISGAVTLGVSIPGYYLSEDVFARLIYSVGESLGVGAIGYGAYLVMLEDDYTRFRNILVSTPELSKDERNKLARLFLVENANRARSARKLRAISHSLMAGLNILNGATASHRELRTSLFFLGGFNTLVALSCLFGGSDEEELAEKVTKIDIQIGNGIALKIDF